MTALSEEEIGGLLAAAEGTPVAVPLLCLVTLGVRRGELLGLTWPDVDFEQGQVSVRRTLEESSAGTRLLQSFCNPNAWLWLARDRTRWARLWPSSQVSRAPQTLELVVLPV